MFGFHLQRVNRFASAAILPMMVLAIVVFSNAAAKDEEAVMPASGMLVVAQLRGEALAVHDLATNEQRLLALPGPAHEMVALNGRLYITLGRADGLVEVDPAGPSITRFFQLPGGAHGIATDGRSLYLTLDDIRSVVALDPKTLRETDRFATGDTPHAVAVDGESLFVTDSRDNALRQLPLGRTVSTGAMPESLAIAGDYVVSADHVGGTLSIFDRATLAPKGNIRLGGGPVRVVAIDDQRVAVALTVAGEVAIVDLKTKKVERTVEVNARPDGICLSPDAGYAAVISNDAGTGQVFRLPDWKRAGTLQVGQGPGACLWLSPN